MVANFGDLCSYLVRLDIASHWCSNRHKHSHCDGFQPSVFQSVVLQSGFVMKDVIIAFFHFHRTCSIYRQAKIWVQKSHAAEKTRHPQFTRKMETGVVIFMRVPKILWHPTSSSLIIPRPRSKKDLITHRVTHGKFLVCSFV